MRDVFGLNAACKLVLAKPGQRWRHWVLWLASTATKGWVYLHAYLGLRVP